LNTSAAEPFLEIHLDCACSGNLRKSVDRTGSLYSAGDEASEVVALIVADAETAKVVAGQVLAKGLGQPGDGP